MYDKPIHITAWNNGYRCFYDKEHPLSTTDGRVFVHRHVASITAGRWLSSDEIVHHIDGNKENNSPDNLQIVSRSEHTHLHAGTERKLSRKCPICTTEFTPTNGAVGICCSPKCSSTYSVKRPDITKELLDSLIPTMSWVQLGTMFGYSDTGIKKRAQKLGCTIPKRKTGH